jgi:hypothetical protein
VLRPFVRQIEISHATPTIVRPALLHPRKMIATVKG